MRIAVLAGLFVTLLLTTPVAAKGITTRITITDQESGTSVDLTDPAVVEQFNIWSGPGTYMTVRGVRTEGREGFIVDWPAGVVDQRPTGLRQYEVKFYARYPRANEDRLAYVVLYERDPSNGDGFVYLPGRSDQRWGLNVQAILHGNRYEGHWFRANAAWQEAVTRVLGAL